MSIKYMSLYKYRPYFCLASKDHIDASTVQIDEDGIEWTLENAVNRFMHLFYETDLTDHEYMEHVEVMRKHGAKKGLSNDLDIIKQGDLKTVKAYLTMYIRMDRFCEGALIESARNWTLYALLSRLHELELEAAGDTGADLTDEDEEILDRVWEDIGMRFHLRDED